MGEAEPVCGREEGFAIKHELIISAYPVEGGGEAVRNPCFYSCQ